MFATNYCTTTLSGTSLLVGWYNQPKMTSGRPKINQKLTRVPAIRTLNLSIKSICGMFTRWKKTVEELINNLV